MALPSVGSLLALHGIRADKSLGQHFLLDQGLTDTIVQHVGNLNNQHVVEIGPGPGALTRSILSANPGHLTAIETDERFVKLLTSHLLPVSKNTLTIEHNDALKYDYSSFKEPITIIANLPYNIGTELIFLWLNHLHHIQSITVMLQKEVAMRLSAAPGDSSYGKVSVLTQRVCDCHIVMDVPQEAFSPPPKVMSSVVQLIPKSQPIAVNNPDFLKKMLTTCFNQRRKMLKKSLKQLTEDPVSLLEKLAIDPTRRPETLTIHECCQLANSLESA